VVNTLDASGILIRLGLTTLVSVVATVAARGLRVRRETLDAFAVGVVLGLLVDLVPRLTGKAMVILGSLVRDLSISDWRGPVATNGPVVIQNVATGLLFGVYLLSLRSQDGRSRDVVAWSIALGVYAFADGLATPNTAWLLGPLTGGLLAGLALVQISRGVALGSAFAGSGVGAMWVVLAALLSGPAGLLGGILGRGLTFERASGLALLLLGVAAALLALLLGRRLAADPSQGAPSTLPVKSFLIGACLSLASTRLLAANLL
jgi:hypothetical protein